MSGYATKKDAEEVVRATVARIAEKAGRPVTDYRTNLIADAVIYSRGHGYGYGICEVTEFMAIVRCNTRSMFHGVNAKDGTSYSGVYGTMQQFIRYRLAQSDVPPGAYDIHIVAEGYNVHAGCGYKKV